MEAGDCLSVFYTEIFDKVCYLLHVLNPPAKLSHCLFFSHVVLEICHKNLKLLGSFLAITLFIHVFLSF